MTNTYRKASERVGCFKSERVGGVRSSCNHPATWQTGKDSYLVVFFLRTSISSIVSSAAQLPKL